MAETSDRLLLGLGIFLMITFAIVLSFSWHRTDFTSTTTQGINIQCQENGTCTAEPTGVKDVLLQADDPVSKSVLTFIIMCVTSLVLIITILLIIRFVV